MNRQEAIKKLEELDDDILIRLAELSENEKALGFFKNHIKYGALLSFLK